MYLTVPFVLAVLLNVAASLQELHDDGLRKNKEDNKRSQKPKKSKFLPVLHGEEDECWDNCLADCHQMSYTNMSLWLCQIPMPPSHSAWIRPSGGETALVVVTSGICVVLGLIALLAVLVCVVSVYRRATGREASYGSSMRIRRDGRHHKDFDDSQNVSAV